MIEFHSQLVWKSGRTFGKSSRNTFYKIDLLTNYVSHLGLIFLNLIAIMEEGQAQNELTFWHLQCLGWLSLD